jgi:putative exporter of polyketide antibiotics
LVALLLLLLNLVLGLIPAVGSLLWVTTGVWIIAYLIGDLATKVHRAKNASP